ncbi:dipeptidase [Nisaea nitritireducens]|uniref:dipeptidase n=1 Tax=Nisaea nitritireducens TaxID=568392 RepID=UPI001866ACA1|nr:dipeptidase [Nisaea nitritireducens]
MTKDLLAPVLARIDAGLDQSVERLVDVLRIPSISTDPKFDPDVHRAAEWMAGQLTEIGFDAAVRPALKHPMVVGHMKGPEGAPHILYYGHYDVQPADPYELWDSDPFDPVIVEAERGKRIVARGAVDDKGQVMTFIEAFRAWMEVHGSLPISVTVLLEGEEESGSESLEPFLAANREELSADACVVCDTGMWSVDKPAITYMLRGIVSVEVSIKGPSRDLHSGMYGGGVINPINLLSKILGDFHDETGRIRIDGFYDDVLPVGDNELKQWAGLGFDEEAFLKEVGLEVPGGEQGFSALERIWARPTLDVNGITGGYQDPGGKTVIASEASAKITCRLVPDQDPDKIIAGLKAFVSERLPKGYSLDIVHEGGFPALRVPTESDYLKAAVAGLRDEYETEPVLIGCGGSIPAAGSIRNLLGMDSLLVGFGLEDDRVHSPNEKFEMVCYHRGIRSNAAIMARLATLAG